VYKEQQIDSTKYSLYKVNEEEIGLTTPSSRAERIFKGDSCSSAKLCPEKYRALETGTEILLIFFVLAVLICVLGVLQ
jgi:hypothetical protein